MRKRFFNRHGGWSNRVKSKEFRSGLEEAVAEELKNAGVSYDYEKYVVHYETPPKAHRYTPDFVLSNGIIIETKGIFDSDDRQKHLLVKKQHPNLDIRFVFNNPRQKLYKGSKTTYGMWCEKNGFKYAKGEIPVSWLKERKKRLCKKDIQRRKAGEIGGKD